MGGEMASTKVGPIGKSEAASICRATHTAALFMTWHAAIC
jgi:hypothetical protein